MTKDRQNGDCWRDPRNLYLGRSILNEVPLEVGDKATEIQRIVGRVQVLMSTHYGKINRESKLKEKVKALRTQIKKRMTESQSRILEIVELDPRDDDSTSKARVLMVWMKRH